MAFVLRSLTARRFRVEGDVPPVHSDAFRKRLAERAFRPPSPTDEKAIGWVTADNCLDADFESALLVHGPCAAFALRIDRRRVPSRILRARIDLEWRARKKAERDAGGPPDGQPGGAPGGGARGGGPRGGPRGDTARRGGRGGREERAELRRQLTEELLRQTPPATEVHPVLVLPRDRVVLFLSLSKRAHDAFRELFSATFDVSLSALTPYHRALEMLEGRGASEALADVRRTEFSRPTPSAAGAPAGAPGSAPGGTPSSRARLAAAPDSRVSAPLSAAPVRGNPEAETLS